jgi:hypothetical protein
LSKVEIHRNCREQGDCSKYNPLDQDVKLKDALDACATKDQRDSISAYAVTHKTVKSFSDIDDADLHLRQAASWMEEQGLMDDVKENEFRPYRYVTKLQTCLVWDKAKEKSLIS